MIVSENTNIPVARANLEAQLREIRWWEFTRRSVVRHLLRELDIEEDARAWEARGTA